MYKFKIKILKKGYSKKVIFIGGKFTFYGGKFTFYGGKFTFYGGS
jgi:hypothetical protein